MKMNYGVLIKVAALRSVLVVSGLMGFAAVALSNEEEKSPVDEVAVSDDTVAATVAATTSAAETSAATPAVATENTQATVDEISNGMAITIDDKVSITPILGWKIDRKALGMALVMKEVLPAQTGPIDYSKPTFARNITLMTLPEARPMDATSIGEIKADITKMFARQGGLTNFMFTDVRAFDYKGKNDGLVLFSQLTVNDFPMMQMQIVISGEKKSYLLTYSDLASNFASPASYEAAWKSMTSITVEGVAPVRFEKEVTIGVSALAIALAVFAPFIFLRWLSARRIRKLAEELQYDWDHGAVKSDADYELSDIRTFSATRPAKKMGKKKSIEFGDINVSGISSFNSSASSSFN